MRFAVIYPPTNRGGKIPLLGQNRQFKFTHSRQIKIYPLIPAHAASNLKAQGHQVLFLDGINEGMTEGGFDGRLDAFAPEIVMVETKTPIIKFHWEWVKKFKLKYPACKVILCGDHVTYFPEESMNSCPADFILTGGDYDILAVQLAAHLSGKREMPAGVYYRENGEVKNSGRFKLDDNLDALPYIDRDLTNWKTYGEAYLLRPCAYILTGRGCGREGKETGGVCTFCIWQHALWARKARLRSAANVAGEVEMLVKKYGVHEIFDDNDSGAVWNTAWMQEFLIEIEKRGIKGKFAISSNARAENLTEEKCVLMKKIGYRLLKVGLESGDTATLHRIGKLEKIEDIIENVKRAKRYGFKVLLTMMVGYPWENEDAVKKTYAAAKELMLYKTHFGDSMQASIIMPYPGTPLYKDAENNGWLTEDGKDYEKMDMEHNILKSNYNNEYWCKKMWNIHKHPLFLLKSLLSIRTPREIALAFRGVKSLMGHTKDY
ncbi:MAG: radical SAM protein [Candidatus Goldbacteria bacterium]|nr:radical SAM protein [Candidatus Goldiibacteriota bacterium]